MKNSGKTTAATAPEVLGSHTTPNERMRARWRTPLCRFPLPVSNVLGKAGTTSFGASTLGARLSCIRKGCAAISIIGDDLFALLKN